MTKSAGDAQGIQKPKKKEKQEQQKAKIFKTNVTGNAKNCSHLLHRDAQVLNHKVCRSDLLVMLQPTLPMLPSTT